MCIKEDVINIMIDELMAINNLTFKLPKSCEEKERLLKNLRTVTLPEILSESYLEAESNYLKEKLNEHTIVDVKDISDKLFANIYIYTGDITKIKADAIVNAANEKLLGCFVPGHHCIDNAIHLAAGLELRIACHTMMKKQGHDECVGQAKVTNGYNLPSKYVVHTVGPNLNGLKTINMSEVKQQLAACYLNVLEKASDFDDINTLVFCSISTGIYGVPIEVAADVALKTINHYLNEKKHHLIKVIIDVFSEEDYDVYKKRAQIISEGL